MKKHIVYLISEYQFFLIHKLALVQETAQHNYQVTVVTKVPKGTIPKSFPNIEIIDLDIQRTINPLKDIKTLLALCRIYRRLKPSLVQHVSLKPILLGSIAAWLSGIPHTLNTVTGLGYLFISNSLKARLVRWIIWPIFFLIFHDKNTHTVFPNPADIEKFRKLHLINEKNTRLIPGLGVDIEQFPYTEEQNEEKEILLAARIIRDKGILEFVQAARWMKAVNPAVKISLVGEANDKNPTKISPEEVRAWEKEGLLQWHGYEQDMPSLLKRVNIVCLPSYREGLPRILLEAAACGRAIVTTDVPGCRDAVIPYKTGLIVPAKDPQSLFHAMNFLIEADDYRKSMGKAGRQWVEEKFSGQIINEQFIDFYEQITCNPPKSSRKN